MKNKRGVGCILTGALLVLALCAVAGGLALWRSSNKAPQILVEIKDPQMAMLANLNEALPLVVTAEADAPITRLEVYANGVLIAASNGEGQNTIMLAQTWAPATAGRHVLVARAFVDAENFADSQITFVDALDLSLLPIQVNVDDLPRGDGVTEVSLPDLAAASGTTPDELVRLNPSLSPAGSIPPGSIVSIPRPASAPPSSASVPPPAPGAPVGANTLGFAGLPAGEDIETSIHLYKPDRRRHFLFGLAEGGQVDVFVRGELHSDVHGFSL